MLLRVSISCCKVAASGLGMGTGGLLESNPPPSMKGLGLGSPGCDIMKTVRCKLSGLLAWGCMPTHAKHTYMDALPMRLT